MDRVIAFIDKLAAFGGADLPEDLAGGIKAGREQNWKSEARYCVIVTDAPCHGKKFHKSHDDYPEGCPLKVDIEDEI